MFREGRKDSHDICGNMNLQRGLVMEKEDDKCSFRTTTCLENPGDGNK
jgi:hypothetical protein